MPKVTDNEDGSKTFSVNSRELRELKSLLNEQTLSFKKVVQIADGPGVRETLKFVRSVVS
ncbi:hypothetical protein SMC26_07410 [Actinomadura fulvescens]|uniref:Uncharacterized protein n=1 Tax=Actinomadura fulvescens TaxID=46160 RepID=A0ABP6C543_9ACTN